MHNVRFSNMIDILGNMYGLWRYMWTTEHANDVHSRDGAKLDSKEGSE